MTNDECRNRLQIAALAAAQRNESSHLIADAVLRLYRGAAVAARVNVNEANGIAPAVRDKEERRKAAAIKRMEDATRYLFPGLVVGVHADGDPRGYSVKLVGLPIRNELGGDWGLA